MVDSTFSRRSAASSASPASSAASSSINDIKVDNKSPACLAQITQQLSLYRAAAAAGTTLSRQEIYAACGSWPINFMWEALFIFHPIDGPPEPFEHRRNEKGQATEFSRWYFIQAKMDWRKPLVVSVELRKVVWGGRASKTSGEREGEGKRDNTTWEDVGPMKERREEMGG